MTETRQTTHEGTCHCGAVRFQVRADLTQGANRCNCSICVRIAPAGVIVKPAAFTLLAGEEALSFYEWGMKIARRYFCRHCGIHCFGRGTLPELGGEFVSVNLNCVEWLDPAELKVGPLGWPPQQLAVGPARPSVADPSRGFVTFRRMCTFRPFNSRRTNR